MKWNEIRIKTPYLVSDDIDLKFFLAKVQNGNKKSGSTIKDERIISIFGRNGSGKTTISNALLFSQLHDNQVDDEGMEFILNYHDSDKIQSKSIELDEEDKQRIYVYNEKFVDRYVRVEQDENLQAIVMLSNDPDLRDRLSDLEKFQSSILKEIEDADNELDLFKKNFHVQNDLMIKSKIENQLKEQGNWASIGKHIRGTAYKQKLDNTTFESIRNTDVTCGNSDIEGKLSQLLQKDLDDLDQIREKKPLNRFVLPENNSNELKCVFNLLSTVVTKPSLSGVEKRIIQVLSNKGISELKNDENVFLSPDTDYCPTCFRSISNQEKKNVVLAVTHVLDISQKDQENNLVNQLKSIKIDKIATIDKSTEINSLFPNEVEQYNKSVQTYNLMIDDYSNAKNIKIDNPFSVPELPNYDEDGLYNDISLATDVLRSRIDVYNSTFNNNQIIKKEADFLNLNLAKFRTRDLFNQYEQAISERKRLTQKLETAKQPLDGNKREIASIKLRLSEQKIALDQINDRLAHVFMDHERLKLVEGENCYLVKSRGEFIGLNQLSVGERNAISLCYFFSRINSNRSVESAFKQPCLIVLDDPISSFDFENKIGILSLLREELEHVLLGNNDSKVLVMTHDAEMFRHISKVYDDIDEKRSTLFKLGKTKINKIVSHNYQLSSGILSDVGVRSFNDYSQQLQTVYDYACASDIPSNLTEEQSIRKDDLYIGNVMRRVIEAFSTFCYQKGISAIFNDPDIMEQIPKNHRAFLGIFMYRLVFNSESHSEENIKSRPDSNSVDFISHDELKKTAKLLLVFMNDLNSLHLQKNIQEFDKNEVADWGKLAE
ncbi:AAA family ATPase [Companilactobacillus huachuanensis]|uniref:Nuclease SbcCD subunit C n=1 Tax=Companilactobacillus huachuanensis TaxID=2559914 RepID=A0ABW1RP40_9LACO|nr:AAA family ATPase [Companilactobacillus huachuanensis]